MVWVGDGIALMVDKEASRRQAGVSLLFARGTRPDADALARLAAASGVPGQARLAQGSEAANQEGPGGEGAVTVASDRPVPNRAGSGGAATTPADHEDGQGAAPAGGLAGEGIVAFSVSHRPVEHPYWLELLALGLTFDLQGLAPGIPADAPLPAHAFALPLESTRGLEALTLRPGPHLAAGANLLPVIRAMAALGCELARLPGLVAVGWEPALTAMTPDYFRRVVNGWLKGGAFPGLGLSALVRGRDGSVQTDGLAFFLGHEILLEPAPGESPADTAKYALRVIHDLVENGPYAAGPVAGPGGATLHCEMTPGRGLLRITRDAAG